MKRVFLVGCPRSGTTLFQALFAAHPEIQSFPETKLFQYALWENFNNRFPRRLHQFFDIEINRPELLLSLDSRKPISEKITWFLGILDSLAVENRKSIWLEKTPEHIFFLTEIARFLPDAQFIHVWRNPLDTIASMYQATRMLRSELWGGAWSLDYCIQRWKASNKITQSFIHDNQHWIVKYEDLLIDKIRTMQGCFNFLGIEYNDIIFTNYKAEALQLSLGFPWHQGIDRDIETPLFSKHKQVFDESEINYILKELAQD